MKVIFLTVHFVLVICLGYSQNATVSGYLKDAGSGEVLTGATCYVSELETGTVTDKNGFYSLQLPEGKYRINFSYMGYKTKSVLVDTKNEVQHVFLETENTHLDDITVTSTKKNHNVESAEMSVERLPANLAEKLPSFMGEADVLRTITLLPGIQSGGEGSSGLHVRGGGPGENLLMLDDAPVYNASHLMGFFSVFNADAIKDIQVYKGGIPATYGGKASSVVAIRMDDGNLQEFSGRAGIGNLSGRLRMEGPIIKNKWSILVSGRRTYADYAAKMLDINELNENQLYFYDLNVKTNIHFSEKDRVSLSAYTGDDYFSLGDAMYIRWGNITGTARWNHIYSSNLFSSSSLIFSRYDYNLGVPGNEADQFDWSSMVQNIKFKHDYTWAVNSANQVDFGMNFIKHHFEPGNIRANENSFFETLQLTHYNALEGSLYASHEHQFGRLLTFRYGLRVSFFQQTGEGKVREYLHPKAPEKNEVLNEKLYEHGEPIGDPIVHPEPRFTMKYSTGENSSVKLSYNRMVQNLHLISNTNSPTPLDIWLPTSKYIKPLIADQAAAGYFHNFARNTFETSVEAYYKNMQNVLDYKDGAEIFFNEDLETELLTGSGYSYGLELHAKKAEGFLTGWISYTLSRTMRQIPGINNNEPYPSSYDRTHDLSVVVSCRLNDEATLSSNWVYATGKPVTYPVTKYNVQGNWLFHYAGRNAYRIPDYHRLDLSFTYDPVKNRHRKIKQTLNISLYNIYERKNAHSVYFRQNSDDPSAVDATKLTFISTVIPSITYNIRF